MSINTELARIKGAKADLQSWVEENGVTVPDGTLIDGLVELAKTVETGGGGGAIYTESITPSEAKESYHSVAHNLGVVPNFAAMYTLDDDTSVTDHAYLKMKAAFCTDVNDKTTICGSVVYRRRGGASYDITCYNANIYPFTSTSSGSGLLVYRASESNITFTSYAASYSTFFQAGKTYNILVAKL